MSKRRKNARRHGRTAHRAKVFISHATADRARAQRLGRLLREHGVDYWFSREHLVHGQNWYRDIGAALRSCNWLAVIATRAAIRNRWVIEEVTYAVIDRRYRNKVIPLVFENCNLKRLAWSIQPVQYLDFRTGWQPGSDRLLKRLGKRPRRNRRLRVRRGN